MEFVKAQIIGGVPTVNIEPDKEFDDKVFLDSLEEIQKEYTFKTAKERSDFVALLCGAFGYSTENINPLLPPVEVGKVLVEEKNKDDRLSDKKAEVGKREFFEMEQMKKEPEDEDESTLDLDSLFLKAPKSTVKEDTYPDDDLGEDGVE